MKNCVCEYDGYVLPKPLDKETEESKTMLAESKKRVDAMAKRFRKENEKVKGDQGANQ